jgi:hypothetical protein
MSNEMKKFNTQGGVLRRVRLGFLMLLIVVAAGCSSIRLTYDHGDTLLYWWLNAYVDLDSDQKAWVKQDIDKLFQWHRKTQLNDYAQFLAGAQKQLQADKVTQADLLADYDDVMKRTQALLIRALPDLTDLARSLKPEQIEAMEKKFAKNNDEFRKKNMKGDAAKQQQFRYDKSMEQFELWFGSFSDEQEAQIRKASDARPLDNQLWLDERMRRQNAILAAVRKVQSEKLGKEATTALLRDLINDSFGPSQHAGHEAFFESYKVGTAQLVLTVIKLANAEQKDHAIKRMQGWIDDFKGLAAEAK